MKLNYLSRVGRGRLLGTSEVRLLIKGSGLPPKPTHRNLEATAVHGFVFCDTEQHLSMCCPRGISLSVQDYFRFRQLKFFAYVSLYVCFFDVLILLYLAALS